MYLKCLDSKYQLDIKKIITIIFLPFFYRMVYIWIAYPIWGGYLVILVSMTQLVHIVHDKKALFNCLYAPIL